MRARIFLCLVLAVCLFSCSRGGKVIPADRLARIYEEMFITDQWVRVHGNEYRKADTSLVYEPILQRYGYTPEDYRVSVEHYLSEPGEYADIFDAVKERLQRRIDALELAEEGVTRKEARERYLAEREDFRHARIFDAADSLPWPRLVRVERDSLGWYAVSYRVPDTLYDGPRFFLRDSLFATDSLASRADSLGIPAEIRSLIPDEVLRTIPVPEAKQGPAEFREVEKPRAVRLPRNEKLIENEENISEIPVSSD